jgi:alkylhydroperoxidase family enzyme
MARVPLVDERTHPELTPAIERLRAGRRGTLINVYRLLLHSPDVALGWFALIDAVRFQTELDDAVRELVIVRVAHLNAVPYVVNQHVPAMALAAGLTQAQCDALKDRTDATLFDATQNAILDYTDAMTRDVDVPAPLYEALRATYTDRQMVELTVLIGAYNMHTRVLRALAIDPEPAAPGVAP